MTKPKPKPHARKPTPAPPEGASSAGTARERYQHEKSRRAKREPPQSELMAAARREYEAMLEAQAAKGKGGRPKKKSVAVDEKADAGESLDDE